MSEVIITPVFTDAGLAAIRNADGNGLQVAIAEIAIGDIGRSPSAGDLHLQSERVRVSCSAGGALGPNQVLVAAHVPAGAPQFFIRELGFFADDGTLLAVWSDPEQTLGYRSDMAPWFFKFVLAWTALPANSLTVTFDGNALTAALELEVARQQAKVRHTVESAGIAWNEADDAQLTAAVDARIGDALGGLFADADFLTAMAAYLSAGGYLRRDVSDVLTAGYWTAPVALTAAAGALELDLTAGNVFTHTLTGPVTVTAPATIPGAGMAILYATQDATGGWGLTLGAGYKVQSGRWSTEAGAVNVLYLTFNGGSAVDVVISQRGE